MRYLALVALLFASTAYADSIVEGNLSFTCFGGCSAPTVITPTTTASSAPTFGSFAFDITTQQFLNLTVVWNSYTFGLAGPFGTAKLLPVDFQELQGIGPAEQWFGFCQGGGAFPWPQFSCDDGFTFNLGSAGQLAFVSLDVPSTYPFDNATGTVTAVNLHTVETPEPGTILLIALASLLYFGRKLWLALSRI